MIICYYILYCNTVIYNNYIILIIIIILFLLLLLIRSILIGTCSAPSARRRPARSTKNPQTENL